MSEQVERWRIVSRFPWHSKGSQPLLQTDDILYVSWDDSEPRILLVERGSEVILDVNTAPGGTADTFEVHRHSGRRSDHPRSNHMRACLSILGGREGKTLHGVLGYKKELSPPLGDDDDDTEAFVATHEGGLPAEPVG